MTQEPAAVPQTPILSASKSDVYSQAPRIPKLMNLVAEKIPTKWYELGIQLEINTATLDTFSAQTNDPIRLYSKVFDQWEREQKVPFTWETIIITLEEADENSAAAAIREWLDKPTTN